MTATRASSALHVMVYLGAAAAAAAAATHSGSHGANNQENKDNSNGNGMGCYKAHTRAAPAMCSGLSHARGLRCVLYLKVLEY